MSTSAENLAILERAANDAALAYSKSVLAAERALEAYREAHATAEGYRIYLEEVSKTSSPQTDAEIRAHAAFKEAK
jgi:hypothetical protein